MSHFLTLLQIADSGFPIGSFGQSAGLEYAIACGWIHDEYDLYAYSQEVLQQSFMCFDVIVIEKAYKAETLNILWQENTIVAAMRPSLEQKMVQAQLGRSFARILASTFEEFPEFHLLFQEITARVISDKTVVQFPLLWGYGCRILGLTLEATVLAFLHSNMRQFAQVAVRLIPLGQVAAQKFLHKINSEIGKAWQNRASQDFPLTRDYQSCIMRADLAALGHANMKARYFNS